MELNEPTFDWTKPCVLMIDGQKRKIFNTVDLDWKFILAIWQSGTGWRTELFFKNSGLNQHGEGYGKLVNIELKDYHFQEDAEGLNTLIQTIVDTPGRTSYKLTKEQIQDYATQMTKAYAAINTLKIDLNHRLTEFVKKCEQENF